MLRQFLTRRRKDRCSFKHDEEFTSVLTTKKSPVTNEEKNDNEEEEKEEEKLPQ